MSGMELWKLWKTAFYKILIWKCLDAFIPPLTFLLVLWLLMEPKGSRRRAGMTALGFLAAEVVVQGCLTILGGSLEFTAGLLPLTLYLPAILCLHLLASGGFFSIALTWLMALLCGYLLSTLRKLILIFDFNAYGDYPWVFTMVLLLAAGALLLLVHHFLRKPFRALAREQSSNWPPLLLLPVLLLMLCSYFLSSTIDITAALLLFFTAFSAFLVLARLTLALQAERQTRESQRQLEALRQDYRALQKKLELGRSYRHDMRHHIAALLSLLQQGDTESAIRYVTDWRGQLTRIEMESWCRNAAVNGVLSAYLTQAREAGCELEVDIALPENVPFEEVDLCMVLANALENAVNACGELPEGTPRQIKLSAAAAGERRLTISVENTCLRNLEFDGCGFPIVPYREGHGQGLKSIAAVAEKYHGAFQCSCEDGMFTLRVVLLNGGRERQRFHRVGAVLTGVFLFCFFVNSMPTLVQALETVPVLGQAVRIVDVRSYSWRWGSTGIAVEEPVLEGGDSAAALETERDGFIRQMQERFAWYAARKYQGYAASDVSYEVLQDDGKWLAIRFNGTINMGGSMNYSRCVTLDVSTGQILELADLFQPEANYLFPISREIKAQMSERINAGEGMYFLPGGMWRDEECFESIEPDQNFYIDENGSLVIVFDEYEVAPGSMGMPEFVIPAGLLDGILAEPSILKQGG